jgi:hypothetical protein
MGIRFYCPACDKKINVKEHQAGLRGFCPKCGARVDIPRQSQPKRTGPPRSSLQTPLAPTEAPGAAGEQTLAVVLPKLGRLVAVTATPPTDPLAESPHFQWYVVPQGATEPFGPADAALLQQWIGEGRVGARSLVWRQDWPAWRKAGGVWSQLVLAEADAAPSQVELRAAAATPRFQSPNVPSMPAPPAASLFPQRNAWSASPPSPAVAPQPPVGFDGSGGELYYPRRSNGLYLVAVLLLTAAVVALGFVMFRVIDEQRQAPPPETVPTETSYLEAPRDNERT